MFDCYHSGPLSYAKILLILKKLVGMSLVSTLLCDFLWVVILRNLLSINFDLFLLHLQAFQNINKSVQGSFT